MRILSIGDPHFKYEPSYASAIKDGRRSEWAGVKKTIYKAAENCDAIVLLGDGFNARHNHSSVIKEFIDFLNEFKGKEIHILAGNHERYGVSTALDFLKEIKNNNWHVYTEPTLTTVAGQYAMMIPFMTPALLGVETKEEGAEKIVSMFPKDAIPLAFMHHAISGSSFCGFPVELMNEIVLPKKDIEQHFSHTFAGHIHSKQNIFPNIYVTGSIFTNEMGEHSKSVWIYESDGTIDVKVEEIPLPTRGIYKIIWEKRNVMTEEIPPNSIVKCYVTDRATNIEDVKKGLEAFDASIIIEQYPSERQKVHFESGVLDLSVDSLLKLYAEAKKVSYEDLKSGYELIKT